jgi:hypothetical protein
VFMKIGDQHYYCGPEGETGRRALSAAWKSGYCDALVPGCVVLT